MDVCGNRGCSWPPCMYRWRRQANRHGRIGSPKDRWLAVYQRTLVQLPEIALGSVFPVVLLLLKRSAGHADLSESMGMQPSTFL